LWTCSMRCASDLVFMIAIVHHDSHRRFSAVQGTIMGFAPRIAFAVNNSQHERTQRPWCDVSSQRGGAVSSTPKTRQERNRNYSRFFSTRIPSRSNLVRTRSEPDSLRIPGARARNRVERSSLRRDTRIRRTSAASGARQRPVTMASAIPPVPMNPGLMVWSRRTIVIGSLTSRLPVPRSVRELLDRLPRASVDPVRGSDRGDRSA
jgi:hypothetical protein